MTTLDSLRLADDTLKLLSHLHRGGSWGYWWAVPGKLSTWWATDNPAPIPAGALNLYFGVHPASVRPERWEDRQEIPAERVRATIPDIAAVNCLFAEFDAKDFGGDKSTTLAHIDDLAALPSILIDSGGGYHAYWLLRAPFILASNEDRERARRAQAAWVAYVGGDKGAKDLARVLRVPGSRNLKYDPPRPVQFVRADFDHLYNLPDLEALARPAPQSTPAPAVRGNGRGPSDDAGGYWLDKALDQAGPGNRNTTGFWLACQLRDAGLSESDAETVMLSYAGRVLQGDDPYGEREALASNQEAYKTAPREPAQRVGAAPHTNGRTAAAASSALGTTDEPPAPSVAEHLTDLGNARRLVAGHGQDLRYCNPWGQWVAWDSTRWAIDDTQEAVRRAKATVGSIYAEAAGAGDDDQRKAIAKHALRSEGGQRIREMLKLAESEPGIPILPSDLDADHWLFNCLNGTLDLRAGRLREQRRGDLLTKLAPVFFDPDAGCPIWLAFLERIMAGDQDLIAYLQRVVGYSLTGDTSEQALFVLHGTGANGKSTFLEAIHEMVGQDYALRIRTETLMVKQGDAVPTDIARLRGARLVSAQETEEGKRLAESLVKQLTGGDTITARFMRQDEFSFKPEFKLFVSANHKPVIRGTDFAMWRRIRLIPFTVTIPEAEQDKQLGRKLQAELTGILAWAVRGCLAWQREGLGMPAAVRSATDSYRAESDILAAFLDERTTTAPEVAAGQLYEAYKTWAESNGEHAMTGQMFGRRMAERGFDKYRKGSLTFYLGLGVLA